MSHFNKLPEFEKEFSKLSKKYRSLSEDLNKFQRFIEKKPDGLGKNFTTLHRDVEVKIIKARLACKSLRNRSIRIIYAHYQELLTFMFIEVYYKGDKENEDKKRIDEYLKNLRKF